MKTFFITLFSLVLIGSNPTIETITATFTGHSEGTYYFEDEDELTYAFDSMSETALEQFDLTLEDYKGKEFKVTYISSTDVNDDDDEFEVLSITGLELID